MTPAEEQTISEVKARFSHANIFTSQDGLYNMVKMHTVYDPTGTNQDFVAATPWGMIEMGIQLDRPAASFFKPGKTYEVTFREVEP